MYDYYKLTRAERQALVQERLAQGAPQHAPPHPIQGARYYLVTASCYYHSCHMQAEARRTRVLDLLWEHCTLAGITPDAWVILPNHYHLLAQIPDFTAVPAVVRRVHN